MRRCMRLTHRAQLLLSYVDNDDDTVSLARPPPRTVPGAVHQWQHSLLSLPWGLPKALLDHEAEARKVLKRGSKSFVNEKN